MVRSPRARVGRDMHSWTNNSSMALLRCRSDEWGARGCIVSLTVPGHHMIRIEMTTEFLNLLFEPLSP